MLEMALLTVIIAPLLLALGIIAWYYYEISLIRSALSQAMHEMSTKTLRVSMGRMDGWLRTRHSLLEAEFPPLAADIRSRVAAQLGVDPHAGSGTQYQIDVAVGYGSFRVDTHGGFITQPALRGENIWIVTYPPVPEPGFSYPVLGDNNAANQLAFAALRLLAPDAASGNGTGEGGPRFLPPSSTDPSPFAIPSGQYGTRLQLHYGPSHAYGGGSTHEDNRSWRPVNDYFRTTLVMSAAITVDFGESAVGRLVQALRPREEGQGAGVTLPTRIEHVEVMSPRNDF